jgi:endonuclease/exonuclease/phosphatase (EEP) superfamily protein YafD
MSLRFICSVVVLFSLQVFAVSSGGYEIPNDTDTIQSFGQTNQSVLPRRFSLLDWNIEKAGQGEAWVNDFTTIQKNYNLILIQEAVSDDIFMNALKARTNTLWNYFVSWFRKNDRSSSGLIVGSATQPTSISFSRTKDTEPFLKTPKLAAYQTYRVQGLQNGELLVINIHAINFVSIKKFGNHIAQVMERVDAHQGPVIFVGDMNTWSNERLKLLFRETEKRNLIWHDFERPQVSGMHSDLDHFFVRGIKVHQIKSLVDIITSDHYPISADLEIL